MTEPSQVISSVALLALADEDVAVSMVTAWTEQHPQEMARAFLELVRDAAGPVAKSKEERLREAHAAHARGKRDSATVLLEREYQRLRKQNNRAYVEQRAERHLHKVAGGGG